MPDTQAIPSANDVQEIRGRFPALRGETVFLENAGGSQVPGVVAERMREYMLSTYVQLGAGYELSRRCDAVVDDAHDFINQFMNGTETGRVILGPSCTQLCSMLAGCYADVLEPGDEVIVDQAGHEANVGPWMKLTQRGVKVRMWPFDRESMSSRLEDLKGLLTERTRLVAFVHVSNLLGGISDIKAITKLVHDAGARAVVDGVAYAPHRPIDVAAWDVDWYVFSTYKTYGPHMAAMYGRLDAIDELTGPNHFFIPRGEVPYKFELGGACHEGCAGLLALGDYFGFLASLGGNGNDAAQPIDRAGLLRAFDVMAACERPVQRRLIDYLHGKSKVRIIGPESADDAVRVGTVSFVHESRSSAEIAAALHRKQFAVRNGHMYAYRICQPLKLDPEDGVLRVSAVHYNTTDEIDRLIDVLETVL